jgi:nitrate/TMAO reductase-like tetraheme cytochrome c subunit
MSRNVRRRKLQFLAVGSVFVAVMALALLAWMHTGPASAAPPVSVSVPDVVEPPSTGGITTSGSGPIPSTVKGAPVDPNAVSMFVDKNGCLTCHGDPALKDIMSKSRADGSSIALYVDTTVSADSVHRFKDCTSCHGEKPHETNSPLTKLSLSEKCGTCHDYEYKQYKDSVHGMPLASGNSDPATCTDCHSATGNPHNVVRVLDPSATTYPKNVADTCAKCHNNPKLMGKYGIVEKVYGSYMRSFHGKSNTLAPDGASLQMLGTATCVNCHGSHDITSTSNPASSVAGMDNLLNTCKACHADAQPEFVKGFLGHKAANTDYMPVVYWGGKGFYIFSRAMLGFGMFAMVGSVTLRIVPWVGRKLRRRDKKEN